jgi:hypothetical protein
MGGGCINAFRRNATATLEFLGIWRTLKHADSLYHTTFA